jgi:hypothetical protein
MIPAADELGGANSMGFAIAVAMFLVNYCKPNSEPESIKTYKTKRRLLLFDLTNN